jgi:hypothetical protein
MRVQGLFLLLSKSIGFGRQISLDKEHVGHPFLAELNLYGPIFQSI